MTQTIRRRVVPLALLGLLGGLLLLAPAPARADDVPEEVRERYEAARRHLAAGEIKDAYSEIARARLREPLSVDFWDLYVRIWRARGKSEELLWERMVGNVEEEHPDSLVWPLLRARFAEDAEQRLGWLRKAAAAAGEEDPGPGLLLVEALLAREEPYEAEQVLDDLAETFPGHAGVLVAQGELLLEKGLERSALEHAEEHLETAPSAGLHALAARALLVVAEHDETALEPALEHAAKARELGGPAHAPIHARVLDRAGRRSEALATLEEALEATGDPAVAEAYGRLAFAAGRYATAIEALRASGTRKDGALRAITTALARLGRGDELAEAIERWLAVTDDEDAPLRVVWLHALAGDHAAALERLEKLDAGTGDIPEAFLADARAWIGAWLVQPAVVAKAVGAIDEPATRTGEERLLPLLHVRLAERLGARAKALHRSMMAARHAAAAAGVPGATQPDLPPVLEAVSLPMMQRAVTYRRAPCGRFYDPHRIEPAVATEIDGTPALGVGVIAACEEDDPHVQPFVFNAIAVEDGDPTAALEGLLRSLQGREDVWREAVRAFEDGCKALASGDHAAAEAAFGRVLEREPAWARARLFQAVARVLAGGDAAEAAALAREAAEALPDDWDGRRIAVLVRAIAGQDVDDEIERIAVLLEAHAPRTIDEESP